MTARGLSDLLSAAEAAALRRFLEDLRRACGGALVEVRLYGRRLRGEGSAIDLFVVVREEDAALRRRVMRAAAEAIEGSGVVFTPVVYAEARYAEMVAAGIASAVEVAEGGIRVDGPDLLN